MGHRVGVVCDSTSGGQIADDALRKLEPRCTLGIHRIAMSRQIGVRDVLAYRAARQIAADAEADILHGHGAKGGAYARLAARALKRRGHPTRAYYTPHGGSLHYSPETFQGRLFLNLERRLEPMTDGLIFESAYSRRLYGIKVGEPHCPARVIPNGLHPHEFHDLILAEDAADFLFIGELRHLKGVDVLLKALALVQRYSPKANLVIVGSGPDEKQYRTMVGKLGLADAVTFAGAVPARQAFVRGRCLVLPSRAESFPYIVLEAAAVALPTIMTNVGGIPEIVANTPVELVPVDDEKALARQMAGFLSDPLPLIEQAKTLQAIVSNRYTVANMVNAVVHFYSVQGR